MNTFRSTIRQAFKQADLTRRERVVFRAAMLLCPEKLEAEVMSQSVAEGFVPVGASLEQEVPAEMDTSEWIIFIIEVLPAILKIIALFL